jgi:glutaredoxin
MSKLVILYTMKGCPFCDMMKDKLNENKIEFHVRDIDQHKDEYDLFVELTENEYVPAFMIINEPPEDPNPKLFAPERDFDEIDDGVEIIKKEIGKPQ